jgi:hypothetical protein
MLVLKNTDKSGWCEKWSVPKNRNLSQYPHPFRIVLSGGPSTGKTNTAKNILIECQKTNKPFKRLIVITASNQSTEWDDCQPEIVTDEIFDMSIFDNNKIKSLIVIDDFDFTSLSKSALMNLSKLFRYYSSHKNISIICSYQSFFHIDKIIRKCSNVFVIYKPHSKVELTQISNRVGVDSKVLKKYFKTIASGPHDSICIDLIPGTPAKVRLNITEKIDYDSDDE